MVMTQIKTQQMSISDIEHNWHFSFDHLTTHKIHFRSLYTYSTQQLSISGIVHNWHFNFDHLTTHKIHVRSLYTYSTQQMSISDIEHNWHFNFDHLTTYKIHVRSLYITVYGLNGTWCEPKYLYFWCALKIEQLVWRPFMIYFENKTQRD